MTKSEFAARLAKQNGSSKAEAADQLDRVVHEIILKLRKGQPATFPGLGNFSPGERWRFQFDPDATGRGGKRARK